MVHLLKIRENGNEQYDAASQQRDLYCDPNWFFAVIRPEHTSPAEDRSRELNLQIQRLADASQTPWYRSATGWFALVAAIAALIGAAASLVSVLS